MGDAEEQHGTRLVVVVPEGVQAGEALLVEALETPRSVLLVPVCEL